MLTVARAMLIINQRSSAPSTYVLWGPPQLNKPKTRNFVRARTLWEVHLKPVQFIWIFGK